MPNPYLTAALRAQDADRPKVAPKSPAKAEEKAAKSAAKSDTATSPKES